MVIALSRPVRPVGKIVCDTVCGPVPESADAVPAGSPIPLPPVSLADMPVPIVIQEGCAYGVVRTGLGNRGAIADQMHHAAARRNDRDES